MIGPDGYGYGYGSVAERLESLSAGLRRNECATRVADVPQGR
ncbi:hypothetical protein [Streptomyces adustus]|nr:hypothetical protein [Streptomyces adustus]